MSMSFKEVEEILKIIDQFPLAEVRFEHGDLKLYVRRDNPLQAEQDGTAAAPTKLSSGEAPAGVSKPARVQPASASASAPTPASAALGIRAPDAEREGLVAVRAPMMGVFYSTPAPDAPPFVTPGQEVAEGDDLCIIEVMKVMNLIKSPCTGIVEDIGALHAAMVDKSQALVWIRPADKKRG